MRDLTAAYCLHRLEINSKFEILSVKFLSFSLERITYNLGSSFMRDIIFTCFPVRIFIFNQASLHLRFMLLI
jgi:hypothetical protein